MIGSERSFTLLHTIHFCVSLQFLFLFAAGVCSHARGSSSGCRPRQYMRLIWCLCLLCSKENGFIWSVHHTLRMSRLIKIKRAVTESVDLSLPMRNNICCIMNTNLLIWSYYKTWLYSNIRVIMFYYHALSSWMTTFIEMTVQKIYAKVVTESAEKITS